MAALSTGLWIVCGLAVAGTLFLLWVLYHFILESRSERAGQRVMVNLLSRQRFEDVVMLPGPGFSIR
jgi:hypothetical protein